MAYKPMKVSFRSQDDLKFYPETSVLLNGGLNLTDKEWKISDNQTSKVLNMWYYQGELGKRWGQDYLDANEAIETPCFNAYKYIYSGYIIKHCGTKLYKQDPVSGALTSVYSGLSAVKGTFFKQNNLLYYMQSGKFIVWNGTTASAVTPYIPTVIINRTPTGGGTTNENYNRVGAGFKNSFNGTGAATVYTLTDTNLDGTTVLCTVGGVAKTEGVDFTVNRTNGVVTFSVAPASGTNNVIITAYKTDTAAINSILNCMASITFGGQNDNRVFVGSNGTGYYYWTGISTAGVDPTYWPYNNYNIVGNTDENITAFGKHYDTLCAIKVKEIFGVQYSFNGTTGVFNSYPINNQMGCDCPDSVQTINNNLVWLSTSYGVCALLGTQVENQRNVFAISRNIDPQLLKEPSLTSATSMDVSIGSLGQYWLCVNDKVYMWDYFTTPYVDTGNPDQSSKNLAWWYFDTINAGAWVINGDDLFYIKRDTGKTVLFNIQYTDFGNGISALYRYPMREMGGGVYEFTVMRGYIGIRGDSNTAFTVVYFTSDDWGGDPSTETIQVGSYSWDTWTWDNLTWDVVGPKQEAVLQPYEKNIRYFGAEFTNSDAGVDMNISSILWQYKITKLVK